MAVNNTLTKKPEKKLVAEYESNGEKIKLSAETIRNYLVSGGGNVTDQEVMMFLTLCKYQHLNPFLKEAYLIKFGNSPATIVTGKDVFTKRAKRNKDYKGKQAGIIILTEHGEIVEREGTFYLPDEKIVGGWAKVYINGYEKPEYAAVSFEEYAGRKSNGELNNQWATKPATMIRKVALVQALREAFPEDFGGMNAPEEIAEANEIAFEPAPIPQEAEAIPEKPVEVVEVAEVVDAQPEAEPEDVQAALFGK